MIAHAVGASAPFGGYAAVDVASALRLGESTMTRKVRLVVGRQETGWALST
jgi:hypothetical protein